MTKMHEAIFDLLPEEQTQMLFLRINASYKLHLKKQLSHLNVINDGGPQNGYVFNILFITFFHIELFAFPLQSCEDLLPYFFLCGDDRYLCLSVCLSELKCHGQVTQ